MKNQQFNRFAIVLLAMVGFLTLAHAQDPKSVTRYYDGQITKIDLKSKTITIKGPQELIPEDSPQGRGGGGGRGGRGGGRGRGGGSGGGGGGGGGGGSAASGGGIDVRRLENVETKIATTAQTGFQSDNATLKFEDLKDGDYVFVSATKNGKKIQAVTIKRTAAKSVGSGAPDSPPT